MDIAHWLRKQRVLAVVIAALVLSAAGCGDHSDSKSRESGKGSSPNMTRLRLQLPWVNATGRKLSSAEIRLHGVSYRGAERYLPEMSAPGASHTLFDDVGNVTWVYSFANVEPRATGEIEIEAVFPVDDSQDRLDAADYARYLGLEDLTDKEKSFIDKRRESVCQPNPEETLKRIRESIAREKSESVAAPEAVASMHEVSDQSSSGDSVGSADTAERDALRQTVDEHMAVLMARACGVPTRIVVGVSADTNGNSGADVRAWTDAYVDDGWKSLLQQEGAGDRDVPDQRLVMRVIPDIDSVDGSRLFGETVEAVGLSVNPGAVRIVLVK